MKRGKKCLAWLAIAVLTASLSACGGSSGGDDVVGATGTISGTALDRNGNPVAGAEVLITTDPVTVTTGADGTFSATVAAGPHNVRVTAADGVVLFDDTVTATANEDTVVPMGYATYDPDSDYAGKLTCKECHPDQFAKFTESGHGFKLNPVVDGQAPPYPFSTAPDLMTGYASGGDNTLGAPASYADVSFAIGGYGWKVRMMDADGFIITGAEAQWNLPQAALEATLYPAIETWTAYHNDEMDKPYDCGRCHTTGWTDSDDGDAANNQDGLPGLLGTFESPAVECEECHGAGKAHAAAPSTDNIEREHASSLCGRCHTRDSTNRIAASGDFGRHHEQYDEWLALNLFSGALEATGPHSSGTDTVDCADCHDPHASTKYDSLAAGEGVKKSCADCHNDDANDPDKVTYPSLATKSFAITGGGMTGLDCVDCHMPRITKSAVAGTAVGTGPAQGDLRTHLFRIDLSVDDQFVDLEEPLGRFMNTSVTATYACKICHDGVTATDFSLEVLTAQTIHAPPPVSDRGYVGKNVCAGCHQSIFDIFEESGHGFKLNAVNPLPGVAGVDQAPTYPFSIAADLFTGYASGGDNTLGAPASYADVSYVIGGYGWKARNMDRDGYIITGAEAQWNIPQGQLEASLYPALSTWTAYHDDEVDKPYNCGRCHTTGWLSVDDNGGVTQDGLPGILGTFEAPGVECEECHGPGETHAASQLPADITVDRSSARCGGCHTRDSTNRIAASGDFGRHHEQYDEWLALDLTQGSLPPTGPHAVADVGCSDCHDPHASTKYDAQASGQGVTTTCVQCHPNNAITTGGMTGLDCVDCHMPRITKSAVASTAVGDGPSLGDIRTHLFRIDLSLDDQFVDLEEPLGRFMNTSVTATYACKSCHEGTTATNFALDLLKSLVIHRNTK